MTYELAKQLKDAGFECEIGTETYVGQPDGTALVYPTLSELIAACGDEFKGLVNTHFPTDDPHYPYRHWLGKQWIAFGGHWTNDGNTPEEAVAKLWLALNQETK